MKHISIKCVIVIRIGDEYVLKSYNLCKSLRYCCYFYFIDFAAAKLTSTNPKKREIKCAVKCAEVKLKIARNFSVTILKYKWKHALSVYMDLAGYPLNASYHIHTH